MISRNRYGLSALRLTRDGCGGGDALRVFGESRAARACRYVKPAEHFDGVRPVTVGGCRMGCKDERRRGVSRVMTRGGAGAEKGRTAIRFAVVGGGSACLCYILLCCIRLFL